MKKILITGAGSYVGESVRNCNFGQNGPRVREAHSGGMVMFYMKNVKRIFGIGAAFNFYTGDLHNKRKKSDGCVSYGWSESSRNRNAVEETWQFPGCISQDVLGGKKES